MIDFRLKDGQIFFESGVLQYVDGAERVRQQLEVRLSIFRGEWFLDGEFGVPYFESILGKQITLNGALSAIKTEILAVDGVSKINTFEYNFDRKERLLTVNFEVETPYGIVAYP